MREVESRDIMIVEDDGGIRAALTEILVGEGYRVRGVANGQQALDNLRGIEAVPGLIIVDLVMPVMNGHEFCTALMRDPELAGIPVVVISADSHLGAQAGDLEAAAYLSKPLDLAVLLDTIEAHCPGA
jgi:CheY-like chemotaxis protein